MLAKLKKHTHLIIIVLVGLFLTRHLFKLGFPFTHDGHNHLARLANFMLTLKAGQFPPRFAPNLDYGFGYPVFNYNYYLPYFLSLPFKLIGLSIQASFKAAIIIFYLLGGIGIYKWSLKRFSNQISLLSGVIYLAAPYQLLNIFVRGNIGEIAAMGLLPWVLISLDRLDSKKIKTVLVSALAISAFWLSHNLVTLLGLPFIATYHLVFNLKRLTLKPFIKISTTLLLFSFGLTAFFYLPVLFEKKFIILDQSNYQTHYLDHFLSLPQIIKTNWDYGFSVKGLKDTMDFSLGYFQVALATIAITFLALKKKLSQSWLFIFWLFLSIFLMLPQSKAIYTLISPLHYLQFPWRWLILSPLLISAIVSFGFKKLLPKKHLKKAVLLLILLITLQAFNWSKPQSLINHPDNEYLDFLFTSSTLHENTSIWFNRERILEFPTRYVLEKNDQIKPEIIRWDARVHHYKLTSDNPMSVVEKTAYFPGWELTINGQSRELSPEKLDPEYPGVISFDLKAGEYDIKTVFTQKTPARVIGNTITLLATLIFIWIFWLKKIFNSLKPKLLTKLIFIAILVRFLFQLGVTLISTLTQFLPKFPYADSVLKKLGPVGLSRWGNFDGVHYLRLAESGYNSALTQAFFPLYPLFTRALSFITDNLLISSLLISNLSFFGFLYFFYHLAKLDNLSDKKIKLSFILLLLFPTSFFFFSTYTESLFLLLASGALYFSRTKKMTLAAIFVSLASATRLIGIFLLPAILWEYYQQNKKKIKVIPSIIYSAISASGLITYLYYLKKTFGDTFIFINSQPDFGGGRQVDKLIMPYQVIYRYLKMIFTVDPGNPIYPVVLIELILTLTFFGIIIYAVVKKMRTSYLLFIIPVFLLPTLTGTFSSMPRYLLACFPLFYLSKYLKSKKSIYSIIIISTILLIYSFTRFISGYWIS